MTDVKAILFDIDGTILDTREFIIQATENALKSCGYTVPSREKISKVVGIPFPEYYFVLAGERADTDKLIKAHRAFQYNNYDLVVPFQNSVETLKILKERGYKLGAVTTRSKKTSIQTLINTGIYDLFDTIISFEDTEKLKPNPDPLFKALEHLNQKPKNTIMVGDSHIDIEAGKNAGTRTIRAIYGFHADKIHEPEPDYIISDIKDLLKIVGHKTKMPL